LDLAAQLSRKVPQPAVLILQSRDPPAGLHARCVRLIRTGTAFQFPISQTRHSCLPFAIGFSTSLLLVHRGGTAFDVLESIPSAAQCQAPSRFPPAGRCSCALCVGGIVYLDVQANDGPTHETFCVWMTQQSLAEFWRPARPTNQSAFPIKDRKLHSTAVCARHAITVCPTEFEKREHGVLPVLAFRLGAFLCTIFFEAY
jgi:hypothetical protein